MGGNVPMPSSLSSPQSSTSSSIQMVVTADDVDSPGLSWRRLGAMYSGVQVMSKVSSAVSSHALDSVSKSMSITMAISATWVSCALPFPLSFLPFPRPFPFLFPPESWFPGFCCCCCCCVLLVWLPDSLCTSGLPGKFPTVLRHV